MKTIEVKTSELIGLALNWAVACSALGSWEFFNAFGAKMLGRSIIEECSLGNIKPSSDWSQCGPLIKEYRITFNEVTAGENPLILCKTKLGNYGFGEDHLIAACRAIVASELGDVVQVPIELVGEI